MTGNPVKPVRSAVEAVTVYRRGALVTRVADVDLSSTGDLPASVELRGLPLALADASLRLEVEADTNAPIASDVRVTVAIPEADPTLPPPDDAELHAAELDLAKLERRLADCLAASGRLESLEPLARPIPEEGKAPGPSPTGPRLALIEFRSKRQDELHASAETLRDEILTARERVRTLVERKRMASSDRNTRPHELRKAARVRLEPAGDDPPPLRVRLRLVYFVPGARWAPAYTVRLGSGLREGSFEMRALVAQSTGEDWTGVSLTLSTASPQQWTELPELKAVKIGRAQPEPFRRGWRPPPHGATELYADYDRDMEPIAPPPPPLQAPVGGTFSHAVVPRAAAETQAAEVAKQLSELEADDDLMLSEDSRSEPPRPQSRSRRAPPPAPGRAPPPMPSPAPAPAAHAAAPAPVLEAQARSSGLATLVDGAIGGVAAAFGAGAAPPGDFVSSNVALEPEGLVAGRALLDYGRLRMFGADDARRGTLRRIRIQAAYAEIVAEELSVQWAVGRMRHLEAEARSLETRPAPGRHRWPETEAGFDYAYPADAAVDLASDGAFHSLPIAEAALEARPRYVSVPRETQDVFRMVALRNPLGAPVLPGPADVYVGGRFTLTSDLDLTPSGGRVELGLGVEQAIKIGRNVDFAEDTSGLLKRQHELVHEIRIELANHLPHSALVEVRERIPVPATADDDDIEISVESSDPPWEEYEQRPEELKGGRKWAVEVPAGGKKKLTAKWTATIPSNHEIVGGNRRES